MTLFSLSKLVDVLFFEVLNANSGVDLDSFWPLADVAALADFCHLFVL